MQMASQKIATKINHLWVSTDQVEQMLTTWKSTLTEIDSPRERNEALARKLGQYFLEQELHLPVISKFIDQIEEIDPLFADWLRTKNFLRIMMPQQGKSSEVTQNTRTKRTTSSEVEANIEQMSQKIIQTIEPNVEMSRSLMLEKAGISYDGSPKQQQRMTKLFLKLVAGGILVRTGMNRGTMYKVVGQ